MCRLCSFEFNRLKPDHIRRIKHRFPGSDFKKIKYRGCSFLFYNEKTKTLKVYCYFISSLRYWFPEDELLRRNDLSEVEKEFKLNCNHCKESWKTLLISPLYICRGKGEGDFDIWNDKRKNNGYASI